MGMHLSGLVLDFYDNPQVLRDLWPTVEAVPEIVKTAHLLSSEEYNRLPNDVFALVMVNSGNQLRKYACIDSGNTEMNCRLFLKNAAKLPQEARKTAALNLITACGWYGIEPPEELKKEAIGLGTAANLAIMGPSILKGTKQSINQNMANVKSMEGGGAVVPLNLMKAAEVSGTEDMPIQAPDSLKGAVSSKKNQAFNTTAEKTSEEHLVSGHTGEKGEELEENKPLTEKQYQVAPQLKLVRPHVDVSAAAPQKSAKYKTAANYACEDKYPLDSYAEVKTAISYLNEYKNVMPPRERHEFASSLVKRAGQLGIGLPDGVETLGASTYAPAGCIKQAFDARVLYMEDGPARDMLESLWEKRAEIEPDVFCETLGHIDKIAMLDCKYGQFIPDPWATTYGVEKLAEDDMWISGNDQATKSQIEDFGLTGVSTVEASYGAEFANEFRKDPWGIFQSLPLLQKRRLARMATDNSPTGKQHVNI